ncbi:hypothetical protein CFE70_005058 [Pyrenophora teres f. teres 0-1]|uniref:RING-type domain-containing protein n=1 Tax=Pyrenophora teres f. teres (strain 0-1) TaxID=861557 RepID=E3RDH3_PYRTT|nr:hypothetical protein PTT_02283 [Pyrenophora teres f. teres 0-1]
MSISFCDFLREGIEVLRDGLLSEICSICLCDFDAVSNNTTVGDLGIRFQQHCGYTLHLECAIGWLGAADSTHIQVPRGCPLCWTILFDFPPTEHDQIYALRLANEIMQDVQGGGNGQLANRRTLPSVPSIESFGNGVRLGPSLETPEYGGDFPRLTVAVENYQNTVMRRDGV